jgi:DNA-binding NarL/FixJ family response regulator
MGRSVSAEARTGLDRWPLIGRSDELALAQQHVANGGSIVIAGDAGVGKTRLARELIRSADAAGRRTNWAVATHAARSIPLAALAALVPKEALGGGREATLRAVVEALERHRKSQLILGVDDAQLLDDVSAVLVHHLVCGGIASAIVTVRTGEVAPDPIVALWKDGLAIRIELQPLSRAEVGELLKAVLGGAIDGSSLRALEQWTAGNVLFLRELVVQGLEQGTLRCDGDLWHWDGPLEPGQRLRDVVAARLGTLDEPERDALEVLAAGEPVPRVCVDELFVPGVLARLERRGLVHSRTEADGVQVRLAHPLFGEVMRADAPAFQSLDVRRRLADAFQARDDLGRDDALRVASWRAEVGDASDPDALVQGARHAWAVGEVNLAERLSRLAVRAGPDFDASYLLGKTLVGQGRFEEAVQTWQSAEDLAASDAQRATLAASIAHVLSGGLGRSGDADDALRRAVHRMEDSAARNDVDQVRSLIKAMSAGTTDQRIEHAAEVLRDPGVSNHIRAAATMAAVTASIEAGQFDYAVQTLRDAIARAEAQAGGTPATMLRTCMADALWPAGRLDEAESVAANGYAGALEHSDHRRGLWCRLLGSIALIRGDARSAVMWLKEAELVLREQDDSSLRGVLVRLSMAAALLGDLDLAHQALQGTESSDALFAKGWDLEVARARAWLCAARGERSTAVRRLEDGARAAACREHWTVEAFALHDLTRFGEAARAVDRLSELAENIDGKLASAMAAHAQALTRRDAVALDAVATTFGELGCNLYAAEAAAAAAAAHGADGRRSSAAASANRARAWMERCEGVRTPALALADHDDDLTSREREVAVLAARGLPDQQIADQLFVSVRTVHAHLRSAYAKLGVPGRKDLAAVLGTASPTS